jgi:hypothetical protein
VFHFYDLLLLKFAGIKISKFSVAINPFDCRFCTATILFYQSRFVSTSKIAMENYFIQKDISVFGVQVKTFPQGIDEAYKNLMVKLGGQFNRSFYGISFMRDGLMHYYATALEITPGEAEQYNCERLIIEKGEYLTITVMHWRGKTNVMNRFFHQLLQDSRTDKTKPAIEWYKNEEKMMCMVRTRTTGK